MAVKKFVVGYFEDEGPLFTAVKKVRSAGYKIHDVYTPMPIHGLDTAMGLRDTSLHTAGFIYGITGTTTALSGIGWIFNSDWPINFGGKTPTPADLSGQTSTPPSSGTYSPSRHTLPYPSSSGTPVSCPIWQPFGTAQN